MKQSRHDAILKIIGDREIVTQHGLIESLRDAGFAATQATVSRDIKELGLVKELTAKGSYRYAAVMNAEDRNNTARLRSIFRECVTSSASARNLVVVKTLPGLAGAASSAIDGMGIPGFVGSVAGDDTVFLAMKDEETAERFCADIENLLR
ncbi:MAG: arginine repressor [Oscillospiraceae bacterium]|jgi:transcriptional regulator of arginine metabolism|nr:arginine repressor [Oscillospiraceae bacterium]